MRHYHLPGILLLISLLGLLCAGCGGGGSSETSTPVTPPVVEPTVKVLPTSVTASINTNTGAVTLSGDNIPSFVPGDVMVSSAGNGLLRKVTTAPVPLNTTGTIMEVQTTQATLTDAFQQAEVSYPDTLTSSDIDHIENMADGVTLASTPEHGMTASFNFTDFTIKPGLTISGTVSVSLGVDLGFSIQQSHLQTFRSAPTVHTTSTYTMSATTKIDDFAVKMKLCDIYAKPITKMVGDVPLVFTPRYSIYAIFQGNTENGAQWQMASDITYTAGLTYDHEWRGVSSLTHTITVPNDFLPVPPAGVSANICFANIESALMIYGITGPYNVVRAPYLSGRWSFAAGSPPTMSVDFQAGIDGSTGMKTAILGNGLTDYSTSLFSWSSSLNGFPRTVETPGGGIDVTVE